jgi:hypothetical protein
MKSLELNYKIYSLLVILMVITTVIYLSVNFGIAESESKMNTEILLPVHTISTVSNQIIHVATVQVLEVVIKSTLLLMNSGPILTPTVMVKSILLN